MGHNRRPGVELGLLLLLAGLLAWGTALERAQQDLASRMIRLHVVANSDSDRDQAVKLQVRDAVLARAAETLRGAGSRAEAYGLLRRDRAALQQAAAETLQAAGLSQPVTVTLERELFGTRVYDSFTLPGGYYDALRVTIGQGAGHNWWCVVYPQICTAATSEEMRAVAVSGGLDRDQADMLAGEGYQLKFRSMELLEDLLGWFRRRSG